MILSIASNKRELLTIGKTPWTKRNSVAFWRGACSEYRGSRPRIELVRQMKMTNNCHLDAAFTKKCSVDTWPETMRPMVDSLPVTEKVSYKQMSKFKYVPRHPKYDFSVMILDASTGTCL